MKTAVDESLPPNPLAPCVCSLWTSRQNAMDTATCVYTKEQLPVIRKGWAQSEPQIKSSQQCWALALQGTEALCQAEPSRTAATLQSSGSSQLLPFPPFKSRKCCGQAWEFQQGWDPARDRWSHQINLVLTYPGFHCPPSSSLACIHSEVKG